MNIQIMNAQITTQNEGSKANVQLISNRIVKRREVDESGQELLDETWRRTEKVACT
jgi:hypothetical protein